MLSPLFFKKSRAMCNFKLHWKFLWLLNFSKLLHNSAFGRNFHLPCLVKVLLTPCLKIQLSMDDPNVELHKGNLGYYHVSFVVDLYNNIAISQCNLLWKALSNKKNLLWKGFCWLETYNSFKTHTKTQNRRYTTLYMHVTWFSFPDVICDIN